MRTEYRIDDFQSSYFVIDSFEQLFAACYDTDFEPLYRRHAGERPIAPDATVPGDVAVPIDLAQAGVAEQHERGTKK